jgi:carboxyl-terminal processing protease
MVSVVSRRLEGDVAYLRIRQFQQTTHEEFLRAVGRIREEGKGKISGVVLDLRSNPGGLVDQAAAMADDMLDQGTIYTTRHRGKVVEEADSSSGGALSKTPVVVLVNEYSASASELLAGALQDHKRGVIVGAVTFGKGSVQSILELPGGAGLKLTTMLYYTPSGRSIQAQGIRPDVVVPSGVSSTSSVPIVRESDYEGHLPSEGDAGAQAPVVIDAGPADGGRIVEVSPYEVLREVPANPTNGKDLVLSIGYQIVRGVIAPPVKKEQGK